ncbi:MAG: hypothetical protein IPP71_14885 [Bacteroidetes bacterium]|nr:hypothetical protein [Bacteroidota bacterium]
MNSLKSTLTFSFKAVVLVCCFVTATTIRLIAQGTGYLEVVGSVLQDSKGLEGSDIFVMKGNEKVDQISTNAGGKFIVNLELNSNYSIIFSKSGNISKTVEVDTKVPEESKDQIFPINLK